jgi:hypothetical protein
MAGLAAKMLMKNAGKMGKLTSKVGGLQSKLGGLGGAAALGGAGAAGVMGVPGIPAGPGMQGAVGAPVTERIYIGPIHKRIYWPATRGEPLPEEPQRQWTPKTVTSSFAGMAGATAVAGGGVVAAAKAPGLFAIWAPTVIFVIGILIIISLIIYYTFYHKKNSEETDEAEA